MFAALFTLGLLGSMIDLASGKIERQLVHWRGTGVRT
jgi:ABC-type nitrate/sulfonate/bicarbonate transport system permease component